MDSTPYLVRGIGQIVLAGGVIALILWQYGGREIMSLLLYVALPLLALGAALGLVSNGTLSLFSGGFGDRVEAYMAEAKAQRASRAASRDPDRPDWGINAH